MKLTVYGTRGSYPISRRDNVRYGGNSTCLYITTRAGDELVMDGGSGIVNLGHDMLGREFGRGRGRATLLVGHTHWDHIMGYPFFRPFYVEGNELTLASAGQTGLSLQDVLSDQHHDLHFAMPFSELRANIHYRDFVVGERLELGEVRVRTFQLNHPGVTVAYRIEADGASLVIVTDTARVEAVRLGDDMGGPEPDPTFSRQYTDDLSAFAERADVLVHDSHFLEHEIRGKEHWGHCTGEDALTLARRAQVGRLMLFHHAPEHSDAEVDAKLQAIRDLARDEPLEVTAATEGQTIEIGGSAP